MTTLQQLITIPCTATFLLYKMGESGLSLHADPMTQKSTCPADELLEYVWDAIPVMSIPNPGLDREHHVQLGVNMLRNQIAIDTRRGVANIAIVQNDAMAKLLENNQINFMFIDESIDPNEIRLMYWRLIGHDGENVAVDGGFAITPDGIFFNNTGEHTTGDVVPTAYMRRGTFND